MTTLSLRDLGFVGGLGGVESDPYFANVKLLLTGNGANNSTSILDTSLNPKTFTTVGDAKISTAQSLYGGSSIAFDGTGDYLFTGNSSDFSLPGDYTIEFWIYPISFGAAPGIFTLGSQVSASNGMLMFYNSTRLLLYGNGAAFLTSSANSLPLNAWSYVAVVRSGTGTGNTVLYRDGVSIGSATNNTSFTGVTGNGFCLGAQAFPFSDATFQGHIGPLRITDRARSVSPPPTGPFPGV